MLKSIFSIMFLIKIIKLCNLWLMEKKKKISASNEIYQTLSKEINDLYTETYFWVILYLLFFLVNYVPQKNLCMKQLFSNWNLCLKIKCYLRRIDTLLTEKPKAEGKHEKILNVNIFFWFWRFISLNDFLVNNNQDSNC